MPYDTFVPIARTGLSMLGTCGWCLRGDDEDQWEIVQCVASRPDSSEEFAISAEKLECPVDFCPDLLLDCRMFHVG
jgi:hypothetical protein